MAYVEEAFCFNSIQITCVDVKNEINILQRDDEVWWDGVITVDIDRSHTWTPDDLIWFCDWLKSHALRIKEGYNKDGKPKNRLQDFRTIPHTEEK